ncbi:unnamed protein product [Notodromas monacha]|uniref:Phospholipid/glycerol acyltransferase domain-containing protein n=1 Tax=Notodromas monacha TaxID=399045 RepID=A0A7R9BVZ9_9CRUS|nr:unnamed protein product [Notodromas monacha]CAG0921595.1 unnamed protein product [Notodromas monacha]
MPVLDQGGDYGFTDLMKAQALDEGVSVDDEDWCSVDSLQQRHRKNPSSVVDSDFVSNADELDPEPETDFPPRRPSLSNDSLVPNPFVNEILIGSWPEAIKITLMTIFVLPIRLIGIIFFFLLTWVLARVGVCGMLESDLRDHPISGWRKRVRETACFSMRLLFLFGGFHWVSVKGKQANSKEAPIVVVAPHSSFFDALPVIMMGAPGLVAKGDIEKTSLLSALLNFTQPVYVWREDPNSRQNTIKEIQRRMESKEDWPQMLLFPEGTCTNRSALITFKPGAFYPGLPVQPVCLRYEADQDLTSWTWKGASWMEVLWRTLARPHTPCEMEFLPVYYPNDAEKADPVLYAKNVRQVMAE